MFNWNDAIKSPVGATRHLGATENFGHASLHPVPEAFCIIVQCYMFYNLNLIHAMMQSEWAGMNLILKSNYTFLAINLIVRLIDYIGG